MDGMAIDPLKYGTLYQTLHRTATRWNDNTAYGVPPMAGRAYYPQGRQYSWAETLNLADTYKAVYASAGYGYGHRVAFLFAQRPEFVFHYYALNALGCSVVLLNPDYRRDEIQYVVEHSEACLAVVTSARLEDMQAVCGRLERKVPVVVLEDFPPRLPEPPQAPDKLPDGTTEAALLYTSGTTGRPKGCILTNEYFHTWGTWYASRGGVVTLREGQERMYNPLPLHHANCLGISFSGMLVTGGALFFPDRFHASTWWRDLVDCSITAVHYQGVIPNVLLKMTPCPEERQHQVRFAFGAGIDASQHAECERRFGFPFVEFWAMSETGRFITDNIEPRMIETRAIGRAVPGLEARAVDDDDNDVPDDKPGELVLRHSAAEPRKGFFSGYLKNQEATEEAWRNGWFHTGDQVTLDASGMFYFLDRKKNIIRRSGENIAAAEIEECLAVHPKVKQTAVLAVADELREEEVMACIVLQQDETGVSDIARELFDWCYERLAYFKVPAWWLFKADLPVTTSQRVHKIQIFPAGVDPRQEPDVIDLRSLKKAPAKTAAH
ncbi:MAG: AMP-binding protein [Acetobacteraceae bacterium]|nr:AMP-binding protein [Acetobacteraceae bacterium]